MISVINRSPDTDVTAQVNIHGHFSPATTTAEEVNGPNWDTMNSFDRPDAVTAHEVDVRKFANGAPYRFPAHSHTVITCRP